MPKNLKMLSINEDRPEISVRLNELIIQYNNSNDYNEDNSGADKTIINVDILEKIIDLSEDYITSIPIEERSSFLNEQDPRYLQLLTKFPTLHQILQLEKNASELLELSKYGQTVAKARWKLLSMFFISNPANPTKLPVKRLEDEYFPEFKYAGAEEKASWISAPEPFYQGSVLSLREFLQSMSSVIYLDNIIHYQLHFKDGLVYSNDGLLFNTRRSIGLNIQSGYSIFALSPDLQLYASDPNTVLDPNFHHSSFFRGRPVLCAGALRIEKGKIIEINLLSGHYKPDKKQLLAFLALLEEEGVDLTVVNVKDHPHGTMQNAKYYLTHRGFLAGEDSYKEARNAKLQFENDNYHKHLETAIRQGHLQAKFDQAVDFIHGVFYPKDISHGIFLLLQLLPVKGIGDQAKQFLDNEIGRSIIDIYTKYNDKSGSYEETVIEIQARISKIKKLDILFFFADFFKHLNNETLLKSVQERVIEVIKQSKKIHIKDDISINKILAGSPSLATYITYKEQHPELFEQEPAKVRSNRLQPRNKN
ncbi:hypothetical protein [Legionella maioricensis]|uniref:Uncharacterized protein n=1 Tax=Legionella maioricensis TaxID=2896528 RepID=A0A9X2CZR3_9GAMM|nr:hypothetical protein [Legionella maioricensis]MCL9683684.1 hypothetical protein [Legionella maioricensis]MCL9687458.1 hypothetical protein [Legionella maioricensis]